MQLEAVLIKASEFSDSRGVCRVLDKLPFPVVRSFTITNVPPGSVRGGHAHALCQQIIECSAGSFVVNITDRNRAMMTWTLTPGEAVHVPQQHWILLASFTDDAVCTVLASEQYSEPIRDYEEFIRK